MNRRDFDALLAVVDPEVEFAARFMEMEGDPYYRGHDGVREWWRALLADQPGELAGGAGTAPGCNEPVTELKPA